MNTDPNSLHDALVELATTMSPNPDRLRQVRHRVARRRHRRVATGAAVSVGAVAGTLGIAMIPREPRASVQFNATGTSLPACASVPVNTPVAIEVPKPEADKPATVAFKGAAVVTAVGDGTLTLGNFSEPGLLPAADSVVVVIDETTRIENNGATATAADATVGQKVALVASIDAQGRNHLDYLDLGFEASKAANATAAPNAAVNKDVGPDDANKAATAPATKVAPPATDGVVTGKGVVETAPSNNELSVHASMDGADPQSVRLALGTATQFFRVDTACTDPELVAGTVIFFSAVANADGAYAVTELRY
jgi:hypothetical protein